MISNKEINSIRKLKKHQGSLHTTVRCCDDCFHHKARRYSTLYMLDTMMLDIQLRSLRPNKHQRLASNWYTYRRIVPKIDLVEIKMFEVEPRSS